MLRDRHGPFVSFNVRPRPAAVQYAQVRTCTLRAPRSSWLTPDLTTSRSHDLTLQRSGEAGHAARFDGWLASFVSACCASVATDTHLVPARATDRRASPISREKPATTTSEPSLDAPRRGIGWQWATCPVVQRGSSGFDRVHRFRPAASHRAATFDFMGPGLRPVLHPPHAALTIGPGNRVSYTRRAPLRGGDYDITTMVPRACGPHHPSQFPVVSC
jgi:hypothetical protein